MTPLASLAPLAPPSPRTTSSPAAPAEAAQDIFRTAQALADNAVPGLADLAAVEVSELALHGDTAPPGPWDIHAAFRRAAFRSVPLKAGGAAYMVGEVSRLPSKTPYLKSVRDLRPRVVRELSPQPHWLARDPDRARCIAETGMHSMIVLPLAVEGAVLGLVTLYRRADSPPFEAQDLRVAGDLAARAARCLDLVRRSAQEKSLGRLLQHSLLQEELPEVSAVEATHGQVSAEGSPGAWFDAVPLPSARIALVVGVAHGEGLLAAAAMGRLRAVIRALAALDMEPSELLARANAAAAEDRSSAACTPAASGEGQETGDHCLYLLYDPASRHCTVSRAGAVAIHVIATDGTVSAPDVAAHPALGSSDHLFEATEFDVPPGTTLLLSSQGPGLAEPGSQPSQLQEDPGWPGWQVSGNLLLDRLLTDDSPALLIARTQALAPDDVACLPIPHDPAAVVEARNWTRRQLAAWTLDRLDATTTLVVSELVTNAIRYSSGPVELRLIRDHMLICEVADTSSAAPHPRHPTVSDQQGRGLCIVTQLTRSVGTRYTPTGKIVWTEQPL
ncbi:SpoIIE family protein phosphatase [Peterkaempfera sp. SMS 1(5)a]|uniref:ATP-binding SpoIIE family protein phosphatase n=1 Tax=Peterkaempfera podocarpi TaxID=3232308 RepID=UPI003672A5F1